EKLPLVDVSGGSDTEARDPALFRQAHPVGAVRAGAAREDLGRDAAATQLFADRADVDVHPAVLACPQGGDRRRVQTDDGERFQRVASLRSDRLTPHRRRLVTARSTSNQYETGSKAASSA